MSGASFPVTASRVPTQARSQYRGDTKWLNVGLALHSGRGSESVTQVATNIVNALGDHHHLRQFAQETLGSGSDAEQLAREFVEDSDLLFGFGSVLLPLLVARRQLNSSVPCVIFALGTFARGALPIKPMLPYINSNDVFVATSTADEALIGAFFPEAVVEVIPLPVSEGEFFPSAPEERESVRRSLGLTPESQLLLYAGRISLEKNLHTTLRVFAALRPFLTDPYLFLAGPFQDLPFREVGTVPYGYARAISRAVDKLGIPEDRVCHLGALAVDDLRAAYNAADVMVNLTLHHDENFGLGQVEAMACGTPVVGTAWGGLNDTIRSGITGYKASTIVTPLGVKVDWWEAVNAIYDVLVPAAGSKRRLDPHDVPMAKYSLAGHMRGLDTLIERTLSRAENSPAPVRASPFAEEFWSTCTVPGLHYARYVFHSRSFELYRHLVSHYAVTTPAPAMRDADFSSDEVLVLATPVCMSDGEYLDVSDPVFPTGLSIPPDHAVAVRAISDVFRRKPASTFKQLSDGCTISEVMLTAGLHWMVGVGLVLRSTCQHPRIAPEDVHSDLALPLFAIRTIDRTATDFLVLRD